MKQQLYLIGKKELWGDKIISSEHILATNFEVAKVIFSNKFKCPKSNLVLLSKMEFDKDGILIKKTPKMKDVELKGEVPLRKASRKKIAKKKARRRRTEIIRW